MAGPRSPAWATGARSSLGSPWETGFGTRALAGLGVVLGRSHTLLEGLKKLQHGPRVFGRRWQRPAGNLGLDQGRQLLGGIVAPARPVQRTAIGFHERAGQTDLLGAGFTGVHAGFPARR